ncbi:MAG: hypothetical protein GY740_14375 [Gammaproteobacteria bacterium]|nr:hypothetical protein [Gammaproteobacteria bacterium]
MYPEEEPGVSDAELALHKNLLNVDLGNLTPKQRQALMNIPGCNTFHTDLYLNLNQSPIIAITDRMIDYFTRKQIILKDDVQLYLSRQNTLYDATFPKLALWRCRRNMVRVLNIRPSELLTLTEPMEHESLSHGFKLCTLHNPQSNLFEFSYLPRPEVKEYAGLYLISHCWDGYWLTEDKADLARAHMLIKTQVAPVSLPQTYAPSFLELPAVVTRPAPTPSPNLPVPDAGAAASKPSLLLTPAPPAAPPAVLSGTAPYPKKIRPRAFLGGFGSQGTPGPGEGFGGPPTVQQQPPRPSAALSTAGSVFTSTVTGQSFPPPATDSLVAGTPIVTPVIQQTAPPGSPSASLPALPTNIQSLPPPPANDDGSPAAPMDDQ